MKNKWTNFWTILKKTFKGWSEDDPFRQSAVIAYYAIFSLPAILVLIVNLLGLIYEKEAISGEIEGQIAGVMGEDTAKMVHSMMLKAGETKAGIISTIVAVVTILFGAIGVFIELQKSLDQIWDVKQDPDMGFMQKVKIRLTSFGLIMSVGFLLLISLVISTGLAAFSAQLEAWFPDVVAYLMYALEFAVSLAVITVLFALMFKILPDVKVSWRVIWVGALLTGLLFLAGKYGLSFYFGKAKPASDYGTAGSLVLILLWVSYSSMLVFFGAEFTKQFALQHHYKIEPGKAAVAINDDSKGQRTIEEKERDQKKSSENDDRTENKHQEHQKKHAGHQAEGQKFVSYKGRRKKINNIKQLQDEIFRKEVELIEHKADVKDDLKLKNLITDTFSRRTIKHISKGNFNWETHMKRIARDRITLHSEEEKSFWTKIKDLFT
jgi:membrane protein